MGGGVGVFWLINPAKKKKREKGMCVCFCGQNDCSARPQIAKTLSQLGQPSLEAGHSHS